MSAIRIQTQISGEMLHLPQLKPLVGKTVEILVTELPHAPWLSSSEGWTSPLTGSVIYYTDPFAPATSPEDWEANR